MNPFWRIREFLQPYRSNLVLNVVFNLFGVLFSLFSIGLIVPALEIILGKDPYEMIDLSDSTLFSSLKNSFYEAMGSFTEEYGQSGALIFVSLWVIIAFFLKNLSKYFALYSVAPLRNGIVRDIRVALHDKILALPIAYFSEKRKGDIVSRMTGDLKEIEWSVTMVIEVIFREPIMIIGSLAILFYMSTPLTLFVLVLLPIVSFVVTAIGKSLKKSSGKAQERMGQVLASAEETLGGLKILKAFNAETIKSRKFKEENDIHFRLMNRVLRRNDLASPVSETLGTWVMALVIWFGGNEVLKSDDFGAEQFIGYILFFYQIIGPSKSLSKASYLIQRGKASAERIFEILDEPNPIRDIAKPTALKEFKHSVLFRDVSFGYGEKVILKGLNFELKRGETLALVGQSGSGKTTIANLLPRFYDIQKGSIEVDGHNIKELKLHDLRGFMGIVSQESILFHGTVIENIALGKPTASLEEIQAAARVANAHEFILGLENGYETNIGDTGGKLSGGQRQRLAIARAVLANPPILILDEATSALDTESEQLVQQALTNLMKNRTSLVIAHRLTTIQHANQILVMDEGKIVERGSHNELLEVNGVYAKLCLMQSFS